MALPKGVTSIEATGVTISFLVSSTKKFEKDKPPDTSRFVKAKSEVRISDLKVGIYDFADDTATIGVSAIAVASDGPREVYLAVSGVKVSSERKGAYYKHRDKTYKELWIEPIKKTSSKVKVRSADPDFQFRFEYPLSKVKGLIGEPTPYQRAAGSSRPSVNPKEIPGLSKHLIALVQKLEAMNLIK